jgi:DNA-binding NtrC family response regulator/tetratricopeptide (TPR) repeat protein
MDTQRDETADAKTSSNSIDAAFNLFDAGDVAGAIARLAAARRDIAPAALREHFDVEFSMFGFEVGFIRSQAALSNLSRLRQLASSLAKPRELASLHLSAARVESLRGSAGPARRHLDLARTLSGTSDAIALRVQVEQVGASLELYQGNLSSARRHAAAGLRLSQFAKPRNKAASLGNLGLVELGLGRHEQCRRLLTSALELSSGLSVHLLALLDSSAALELFVGDLETAEENIRACAGEIRRQSLPSRSWYDLAHQITRCHYFAQLEDWQSIVDIVTEADRDLEDRQLRTWRASLLSAKAKALAHLERHEDANLTLLDAMATCPKEAIDPKVTIEAATGTVLALRGEGAQAAAHFDRALHACHAIGHRFLEWVVDQDRARVQRLAPRASSRSHRRSTIDLDNAALVLADVSSLLSAGHSVDLLAQRALSVFEATRLRSRIAVTKLDTRTDIDHIVIKADFDAPHGCRLELIGPDRSIQVDIRDVGALEELTLITHVVDLMRASLPPGAIVDDDQLWPEMPAANVGDAVFWSPRMQELVRVTQRLAATDLPLLITGETGTGKEVFARLIHEHSRVKRGPFVPFNAAAIPRELVESQLFGHRRGAFTGALDASTGVIRGADQGTLFLDEIGELDPLVQPKLLRFLEAAEVHPVGDNRPIIVQVRIVAATNAHLERLVSEGRFRSDLLFRLRVAAIDLPPLRERKDEIPALTAHFVRKAMAETRRSDLRVGDDLVAALLMYDWPGNLRELANELRRVVAMADDGGVLSADMLSRTIAGPWFAVRVPREEAPATSTASNGVALSLDQPLEVALADVERRFIERAMQQTGGNVTEAAEMLGISRKGLFLKRKKLGLR